MSYTTFTRKQLNDFNNSCDKTKTIMSSLQSKDSSFNAIMASSFSGVMTPTYNHVLFTDPAVMGPDYFSSSGDVDDIACIIFMAQVLFSNLTVVICDDKDGVRYDRFMASIGNRLSTLYGCTFVREPEFVAVENMVLHIHAPIKDETADKLSLHSSNIVKVFRQGDDNSVNFKSSPKAVALCESVSELLTTFDTTTTKFSIPFSSVTQALVDPHAQKVYDGYFEFAFRKVFGLPLMLAALCDRLYSNTGFNGGPGNGIRSFLQLIAELRRRGVMPEQNAMAFALGQLETALVNSLDYSKVDESTVKNVRDIIFVLNMVCDYESLIVDGKIPNMGTLGNVVPREHIHPLVQAHFSQLKSTSTPLFDFAAGFWAVYPEFSGADENFLTEHVLFSLRKFSEDSHRLDKQMQSHNFAAAEMVN